MGNRRDVEERSGGGYTTSTASYDRLNGLVGSSASSATALLSQTSYSHDDSGNLTGVSTGNGGVTYSYDEAQRHR